MFDHQCLRDDGSRPTRSQQSGQSRQKMHEEHQKVTHWPRSYRYRLGLQVYEMRVICRDNKISPGTPTSVEVTAAIRVTVATDMPGIPYACFRFSRIYVRLAHSFGGFGGDRWITRRSLNSGLASECIDAPGSTTRKDKVQKNKTIQNSCITAIQDREKTSWRVSNEIGECHNSR